MPQQVPGPVAAPPRSFSGGLVTSRDPVLLQPDELQQAADAEYLPDDPGPWKIAGRSAFAAAEASQINGLAFLEFDPGTAQDTVQPMIVAMVGKKYRSATAGATGTLSDLATDLSGTAVTLDQVHLANQHFLLNGVDRNHYVQSSGQVALHGMKAQIFGPVVDPAAGAGTGYTLNSGKTVTYWIEERVKDTHGNIVRRSASTVAQVTPITGTGAVVKPRIYRPVVPANADATHWAVFATATNGTFPTGAEIAEEDISDTYIDDANTTTDPPLPLGSPYSILQTTIAGVIQSVARYGPAPVASTGDVYKSCLCINDVANPRRMWFSFYRTPQAYPANNYFEFDGKEHDTITCIRTAGNVLVVLLKESAWRVTDLPFPEDADQTPDNYKERVEGAFGCVGPLATAYIPLPASEYPRSSLLLAYVSRYGLMATDGSAWWHLSRDLDWPGAFDLSQLATARLLNNARKFRLELYALDPSGNRIAYYFAYHPSHLKPGMRLKVTGPIHRDATAAVMVRLNGLLVPFTAAANKVIYQNDVGTSEPAYTGGIQFMVRSGVSYPFGVGNEGIIRRVLVHHGAGVVGQTAAVRVRQYNEKRSTVAASGYISLTKNEGTSTMNGCAGEAFDISVENSDTLGAFRVNMYALVEQSAGEAQPA